MTIRRIATYSIAAFAAFAASESNRAFALFGVGDTVIVAADVPAAARWAEETVKWTQQLVVLKDHLSKATEFVNQAKQLKKSTEEILAIAGDPRKLVDEILGGSIDGFKPLRKLAEMPELNELLKLYADSKMFVKQFKTIKAAPIKQKIRIVGKLLERDNELYSHTKVEEVMEERLTDAIQQRNEIVEEELKFQEQTLEDMDNPNLTENEIHLRRVALAASKDRMDAAEHQVTVAKYELDMQSNRLKIEQRKAAIAEKEELRLLRKELGNKVFDAIEASWPWD